MYNHVSEAVVLVGGKGTRLRSVVSDRPKPMAEVRGRPFLDWLVRSLKFQGIQRVILATGYKGEMVEAYFGNGSSFGLEIVYSQESRPAGTGGAIRLASSKINGDRMVVLNGDSLCPIDLDKMNRFHQGQGAGSTLWLVEMNDCSRYGTVVVGESGKITAFQEKSPKRKKGLINAGVYLFERRIVEMIPPSESISLENEVFPQLVNRDLFGVVGTGPFIDIGTPDSYAQADLFVAQTDW